MRFTSFIEKRAAMRSEFYYIRFMEFLFDEFYYVIKCKKNHFKGHAILNLEDLYNKKDTYYQRLRTMTLNRCVYIITDLVNKGLLEVQHLQQHNLNVKNVCYKILNLENYIKEINIKKNNHSKMRRIKVG
tara:strand:- start:17438 stop:17827 length:390 start_codon:yes stop_codon:yes gene_type:complete